METQPTTTNTQPEAKPPVIPKAVKNFFFYGLKKSSKVKKVAKEYGEVKQIAYMIVPPEDKRIMRVLFIDKETGKNNNVDVEFSVEEMEQFLKVLNKTKADVEKCKTIFIMFDMTTSCVSYQQETKDGNKLNFTI